ncbi:hypothetical protein NC651_001725 [Populus alba x Populus x berolinensis]|nr:hypothetical protein NC651_001725 [Populus alba x Populus x berolinensis]
METNMIRGASDSRYLHKFRLYETRSFLIVISGILNFLFSFVCALVRLIFSVIASLKWWCGPDWQFSFEDNVSNRNFYMIGGDKNRTLWRVLKIDRLEPSELIVLEDSTTYSESECCDLLRRIHEGNKSTGGLKFVTICYGIVGFIKFLGPYYMLLITKRRKIGAICGHTIYAITKSEMIPIPNSAVRSNMTSSKNENRSFVHSACKCNMYSAPLRRSKRLVSELPLLICN